VRRLHDPHRLHDLHRLHDPHRLRHPPKEHWMPESRPLSLPRDFLWGVSTAAYQIEGGVAEGGRGPSSWDAFSHTPGRVHGGDTGDVACDHYHRYAEDVALMQELGVDAYRFSFSWSRIQPDGRGAVNPDGLGFYDRLVDALLASGISPAPTLFHWDTPLALEADGGWLNRDTALRFADYAYDLGEHFADRIGRWITINEPVVLTTLGYGTGIHAPGLRLGLRALPAAHHLLLGHGLAVSALRAAGAREIGIANNHTPVWRASDRDEDVEAAATFDALANRLFADPILLGSYPDGFGDHLPAHAGDDLSTIHAPLDWYGINYYNPTQVAAPRPRPTPGTAAGSGERSGPGERSAPGVAAGSRGAAASQDGQARVDGHVLDANLPFRIEEIRGYPLTDFGWPVVPAAFTELLVGMRDRYGDALPPIYITENGCSAADGPGPDGSVHDSRRISFTEAHLSALADAVSAGVDVRGYFHWSLMDNFEWAAGFSQRFGLVYVDYPTQKRTPKDSFWWYRDLLAAQR
jgi:beta-glucosidase